MPKKCVRTVYLQLLFLASLDVSFFNGTDSIIKFFKNNVIPFVTNPVAFTFKFRDSRAFDPFYCFVSYFTKKLSRKSPF